jgi:hypothetical protein
MAPGRAPRALRVADADELEEPEPDVRAARLEDGAARWGPESPRGESLRSKGAELLEASQAKGAELWTWSRGKGAELHNSAAGWYEADPRRARKRLLVGAVGCAAFVGLVAGVASGGSGGAGGAGGGPHAFSSRSFGVFGNLSPEGGSGITGYAQLSTGNNLTVSVRGAAAGGQYSVLIHAGLNCTSAGEHYFQPGGADPWAAAAPLAADATGTVLAGVDVGALAGAYGYADNVGHAVVVHDLSGAAVACGVLAPQTSESSTVRAVMLKFPGLDATVKYPGGNAFLSSANVLSYQLERLEPGASFTLHIHQGRTCQVAGGHYFQQALGADPWSVAVGMADGAGGAGGKLDLNSNPAFYSFEDNVGHALVLHNGAGVKVACGELRPQPSELVGVQTDLLPSDPAYYKASAQVARYPGLASGAAYPTGTVSLDSNNFLSYSLKGLDANAAHGVHIHVGRRCDADTGGHLWDAGKGPDAWEAVQVFADDKGRAFGSFDVDNVAASLPFVSNLDRTVTIHASSARGAVRTGCAVLRAKVPYGVKASMGLYPGSSSAYPVGQVVLDAANVLTFLLEGLPAGAAGTLRIHAGTSCSAAGEDWYDAAAAQAQAQAQQAQAQGQQHSGNGWLNSTWRSDAGGEARGMFNLNLVPGLYPFSQSVGRVVVVHDAGGAPIGCGKLQPFAGSAVAADDVVPQAQFAFGVSSDRFERVRGFSGSSFAKGRVWLDTDNVLTFALNDLEPNKTGGIHIHSGTNCSTVGGHLIMPAARLDGWPAVSWTSSLGGFARGVVDLAQSVPSAYEFAANLNRVVVVHNSSGAMQSCIVLRRDPLYGVSGAVQPYVGLAQGVTAPTGNVFLGRWNIMSWFLFGLAPNSAGGIHIHAAAGPAACTDPAGTGAHWFNASMGADPWAVLGWTSSASGIATGIVNLYDVAGVYAFRDNVYHAVTIHNAAGTKVGCALLHTFAPLIKSEIKSAIKSVAEVEAADKYSQRDAFVAQGSFAPLPGKDIGNDKAPEGSVALSADNILTFQLAGLVPRARGPIAVLSGKACSAEDQGGDHWVQDSSQPDPWSVVQWASDSKGVAKGIIDLDALSDNGFSFAGNLDHAVVVSSALSPSLRLACATLSSRGLKFGLKAYVRKSMDPNAMSAGSAAAAVLGVAFLDNTNKLAFKLAGVAPSAKHVVALHEDQFCDVPDSPVFAKLGATQAFNSAAAFTTSAIGALQGAVDLAKVNGTYEFERNAYKSVRVTDSASGQVVACGSLSVFKLQTASQVIGGGGGGGGGGGATPPPSGQQSSPPVTPPTPGGT